MWTRIASQTRTEPSRSSRPLQRASDALVRWGLIPSPIHLRWYLLGLGVVAIWLYAFSQTHGLGQQRPVHLGIVTLLGWLAVLAYQFPVLMAPDRKAHVANSPLLVAALLYPTADAIALAFVSSLMGNLVLRMPILPRRVQRRPLWNCVFNAVQMALAIGIASAIYHLIDQGTPTLTPNSLPSVVAVVIAAIVAYVFNTLAVAVGVTLFQGGDNILERWLDGRKRDWRQEIGLALLALVTALLVEPYPWAVVLQAGSVLIVHLSYKHTAQLLMQTRSTLERLARAVDSRDPYTALHSQHVANYAARLAERAGLPQSEIELIRLSGLVHDVGKIGVRDAVLLKPGRLTDEEYAEMKRHSEIGAEMVGDLEEYRNGRLLILHHHEAWDGSGYPHGLHGEAIPLGARILAIADSYDAMMTDRPYRKALPLETVIRILRDGRGKQWDPRLIDLWLKEIEAMLPQNELAADAVPVYATVRAGVA